MDKNNPVIKKSAYQEDLQRTAALTKEQIDSQYLLENGNKIRVPYRMVKQVIFTNVEHKGEFSDPEHAARLQYRLLLNDAILKARVHYIRNKILIIYNPEHADNLKDKISLEGIRTLLKEQKVEIDENSISDEPYDYYKDFYTYAFASPSIREHPPYGYTIQEWKKMKPEWNEKVKKYKKKKDLAQEKFRNEYLIDHPELAKELGIEIKDSKKNTKKPEKGF